MKRYNFQMILAMVVASIFFAATCSFAGSANIRSGENVIDEQSDAFEHGCDHDCQWWWEKSVGHNNHMFFTYAVDEDEDGNNANGTYGKWKMNIIDPGKYEVKVFIPSNYAESKHAKYKIKRLNEDGDTKEKEIEVDQSDYYNAWVSLGTYYFNSGDAYVKLKDDTGESYSKKRRLAYDAVMMVSTDSPQPDPSNGEPNYVNGSVNPSKGYSGASFAFWTKWQDPENDYIVDVKVRYRKSGSSSWNEVLLRYIGGGSQPEFDQTLTITGSAGTYEYQFQASDANPADGPRKHTTAWKGGGTFELQDRSNPSGNNSNSLNVPLYGQREDNWAGNKLGTCSTTIGKMGCAITSIAMVFKYYGVDTDPADMNSWLKANGGYADGCLVKWSKAAEHSDGKVSYDGSSYSRDDVGLGRIRKAIDEGHPVIAEVRLFGDQHFVVITGYLGDTFYINDPYYKDCSTINERYGNPKKAIYGIRIYHGTGGSQPNPSPQPTDTVKFPATKITKKSSTSKFAGSKNAFAASSSSLRGQCTWYTYGRVMELVDAGYLAKSVGEDFKDAFWGKTGRDAKKWPSFLGGNWTCTNINPLPMEKRRKGLVAVWKGGKYGHVGFVEEVSDDKTKYRLSDFNRKGTQKYMDDWYRFEGTDDKLLGGYPCFYELELAQPAEFRVTPNTKTYFASSGTIYPGQTIAKSVTLPSSMSGSTQFAVSWPGSDLDLVITTPSGKVLTSQSSEVTDQYEGDTEEYIVVNVNEEGEWKVEIVAVEVNPNGEPYSFEIIGLEEKDYDIPDTDGDGISDDAEIYYNLNPLADDAPADADNDGVSNLDEYLNKTDPNNPDTDGDGYSDLEEINKGTDPSDWNSTPVTFNAGIFTVDETGIVKIDWLYDGGKYQGEFGIFSIAGMENLTPGSSEFIAEAVKRVMSNSEQGYLVFSDLQEGARFSGILGNELRDWNAGQYKGMKNFAMPAGTQFATILVPNSTFASLSQNPGTTDTNKRPLFSLVSQNPAYGMYLGQMADINGMGKAYSYEDKDAETSDWDFNDLIVQITGAESDLPSLDSLVGTDEAATETRSKREKRDNAFTDWRTNSELGEMIMSHVEASAPTGDSISMTITLNVPATLLVYDPKDNVIGKDGGYIAGANFELKADGTQIVTFPNMNPGSYRISVQGTASAQGILAVRTYQGSAELSSDDVAVSLAAHQTMTLTVSSDSEQPFTVGTPAVAESYDFSGDGVIDNADVSMIVRHWNSCRNQQKYDPFYDLDEDGCITVADVMKVLNAKTVK